MHASLEFLVQESANPLLKMLFATGSNSAARGKLNFISVGSKFKTQLGELMDKLEKNVNFLITLIFFNNNLLFFFV